MKDLGRGGNAACTSLPSHPPPSPLLQDSLSTIEALNARLGRIKDKASADSGAPEIAWIAKKYAGITARLLKAASPADSREASRDIAALRMKAKEVTAKFQANMLRIQKEGLITPELAHALIQMYPPSARPSSD